MSLHFLAFTPQSRAPRRRIRPRHRPSIDALETRVALSASSVTLGSSAQFAVLGLPGTHVNNLVARVEGNEGVSRGGALWNSVFSNITGSATVSSAGEYTGGGRVGGGVAVNADALARADSDALAASAAAASLTPTQTLGTIKTKTTVTGNGGLNVIAVNGDIRNTLILSGTASDIFVVNVSGGASLFGNATLGLAGGVTADHVLYNFTGGGGSINLLTTKGASGTLLAPQGNVNFDGALTGAILGGGGQLNLLPGAEVKPLPFSGASLAPPATNASLSGGVASQGVGLAGVTVTLTGVDSQGNAVNLSTTTGSDGAYSFGNLAPGTYEILAPQVPGAGDYTLAGTVNGEGDGTVDPVGDVTDIVLNQDDQGVNFDFVEIMVGA